MKRRRRKRGRPATGHDPVITVRLPAKLLHDIDAWASVYDNYERMSRSTAIRCLVLLGLESVQFRVVDPKDKMTFEGATLPLLKFYRRGDVGRWLLRGTPKAAKLKPPAVDKPRSRRAAPPTKAEIDAVVARAIARSKDR
jgi:hypothetical protein